MKSLNIYLTEALDGSRMKYTGKHTQFADIIIENEKGEILILRRANYMKNFRTCWCIPGGNVDAKDKNTVDTVVRETMEETGIEIDMAQQLKLKPIFTYKFENGNVSDIYYIKLENTPDVKLSREHSKYEWVRFSDEKIDARKWVPETFTILQKWETKPMNEKLIVNKDYTSVSSQNFELDRIIDENVNWDERLRKAGPGPKRERDKLEDIFMFITNSFTANGWDHNAKQRAWRECNPVVKCEELFKYYDKHNTYMFIYWPDDHNGFSSKTIERTIDIIKRYIANDHFDINYIYNTPRMQIYSIEGEKYLYFYSGGKRYAIIVIGKK